MAAFAADLRRMTICFIQMDVDLGNPTEQSLRLIHHAFLTAQRIIYRERGTIRQLLQDDKGLIAIAIFGMPPFSPLETDALCGMRAMLAVREELQALGIPVAIGAATGTAYSGFVGSLERREMCAMGTKVNMAARLMSKAGPGGLLVDEETRLLVEQDRLSVVEWDATQLMTFKGMNGPQKVNKVLNRCGAKFTSQHFSRNDMSTNASILQNFSTDLSLSGSHAVDDTRCLLQV